MLGAAAVHHAKSISHRFFPLTPSLMVALGRLALGLAQRSSKGSLAVQKYFLETISCYELELVPLANSQQGFSSYNESNPQKMSYIKLSQAP